MVGGLIQVLTRLAIVWIPAWTLICCGCIPVMDEHSPQWSGVRFVLWAAALTTCVWEARRMNRQFIARTSALKDASVPRPHRLDKTIGRPLALIVIACIVFVVLFTRWFVSKGFFNPVEFISTMVLSVLILTLMTGAWSTLRYKWASRRLPVAPHPRSSPLFVAVCMSAVMVLLLIRSPRSGAVRLGSQVAIASLMRANDEDPNEIVELLIELGPDDTVDEIRPILRRYNAVIERAVPSATAVTAPELARLWTVSASSADSVLLMLELAWDQENVSSVEVNQLVAATAMGVGGPCTTAGLPLTNDPLSAAQAPLAAIGASPLLARPNYTAGLQPFVQIHVLDDGVQGRHEDLHAVTLDSSGAPGAHGTAVAGIAAAQTHNGTGIASLNGAVAPFRIIDHDILDGTPTIDDIAEALVVAADNGADVALLAMNAPGRAPAPISAAAAYAQRNGVVLVTAAGNRGGSAADSWPANLPGVVVATAWDNHSRAPFSAWGGGLRAVSAPGVNICAPTAEGGYAQVTGTSMSAAFVAGAVAVYAAHCPSTTAEQRIDAVLRTARPNRYGSVEPLIDVSALATVPCPRR